jgi:hypothetical protein
MPALSEMKNQIVTGVVSPEQGEAWIRTVWPSVAMYPAVAGLGRTIQGTPILRIFAPLAWALMAPFYFRKVLPGLALRYTLTNRRLMIRHGLRGIPGKSVNLADIDEVRIKEDANTPFFRAATLEIISNGQVVLELPGVTGYDSFRHAILNAVNAWVPGKASRGEFIAASAMKK